MRLGMALELGKKGVSEWRQVGLLHLSSHQNCQRCRWLHYMQPLLTEHARTWNSKRPSKVM